MTKTENSLKNPLNPLNPGNVQGGGRVSVDGGALQLAVNVLRRAQEHQVVDNLTSTGDATEVAFLKSEVASLRHLDLQIKLPEKKRGIRVAVDYDKFEWALQALKRHYKTEVFDAVLETVSFQEIQEWSDIANKLRAIAKQR